MLTSFLLCFAIVAAKAQKWQKGFFIDTRGQKVDGLIRTNPSGKAPIKNEGFIVYKENEKGTETRLSASDIRSFVAGQDSFVVAHAPNNETWSKEELDFVRVVLNDEVKLYALDGGSSGGGGSGFSFHPGIAIGGGSYGGMNGGLGVSLGGGGGNGSRSSRNATYYFGTSIAKMQLLTVENFNDAMMDVMGDEPQAIEAIRSGKYTVGNVNSLIAYYRQLKASRH